MLQKIVNHPDLVQMYFDRQGIIDLKQVRALQQEKATTTADNDDDDILTMNLMQHVVESANKHAKQSESSNNIQSAMQKYLSKPKVEHAVVQQAVITSDDDDDDEEHLPTTTTTSEQLQDDQINNWEQWNEYDDAHLTAYQRNGFIASADISWAFPVMVCCGKKFYVKLYLGPQLPH